MCIRNCDRLHFCGTLPLLCRIFITEFCSLRALVVQKARDNRAVDIQMIVSSARSLNLRYVYLIENNPFYLSYTMVNQ